MASKNLNVAVIGLGYMGQNHARVFSSMAGVNLVAVVDIDEQKVGKLIRQYKIAGYTDYQKLLVKEKLAAVSICVPTSLHYEIASLVIKKRIPVFVEKPIAATVDQAKKLIAAAARYRTPMMVGHIERFNPVVLEIKQRITSGELGKIFLIHTERFSPPPLADQKVPITVDLATHDIDVIFFLLDGEAPIKIKAEVASVSHTKSDLVSAILRFRKGVVGIIQASLVHPIKKRMITILGEKGMYVANYITQELYFYRQNRELFARESFPGFNNKADIIKIAFESKEPLGVELEAFIHSLRMRKVMPVAAGDALRALEVAYKIEKAGNLML